jgi:hypothetical protein
MKKFLLFPVLLGVCCSLRAQHDDLATVDGLMRAFYSCLDVEKGKQIDSARFMNLFWPGAQLDGIVNSRKDSTKMVNFRITPEEYLDGMKEFTATHRFKEWELGRQTISYGHMMSIFSGYELIDVSPKGDTTRIRGVNTFQVFFDGKRWWITYCNYEEESSGNPLPEIYRKTASKGVKRKE